MTDYEMATEILKKLYVLNFPEPLEFRPTHKEFVIVLDGLREYARSEMIRSFKYLIKNLEDG